MSIADSKSKRVFVKEYTAQVIPDTLCRVLECWGEAVSDSDDFNYYKKTYGSKNYAYDTMQYQVMFTLRENTAGYNSADFLYKWDMEAGVNCTYSYGDTKNKRCVYFVSGGWWKLPDSVSVGIYGKPKGINAHSNEKIKLGTIVFKPKAQ